MIRPLTCALFTTICFVSSCASPEQAKPSGQGQPFGPGGIPPMLRPKSDAGGGTPIIPGGNQPPQAAPRNMTPEDDIVFTDPDNPDATVPELSSILDAPKIKSWEESDSVARRRAAREGKPILIWFTDSARSPMCKALSQELFSTSDFEKWAGEKIIRLRVDSNVQITAADVSMDDRDTRESKIRDYVDQMKKRYKVLGYPSIVMLNPSGEVIARYRGYKRGDANFFWGRLKHNQSVSEQDYKSWRSGLEQKGYRDWEDRKGRKVFAKLKSYSQGELILVEPDGTRSRTKENVLSGQDRDWLDAQKKVRGLQ